jgi:hypothetical protein
MARLVAISLLMILVAGTSAASEEDRILYLTVKYAGGTVSLDDAQVVDGTIKQPRQPRLTPGSFYFAVAAADGDVLFTGTVPDPTLLHVEYEDDQGRLQKRTARQDPAIFVIRIPYDQRSHSVTIRRIDSTILDVKRVSEESTFLGTLVVDEEVRNR